MDPRPSDTAAVSQQRFADAHERLVTALRAAVGPERELETANAYDAYATAVAEALSQPPVAYTTSLAWQAYLAALERAFRDTAVHERANAAFRTYVEEIAAVWSEIDPAELDPPAVAAIANGLGVAAWLAAAAASDGGEGERGDD